MDGKKTDKENNLFHVQDRCCACLCCTSEESQSVSETAGEWVREGGRAGEKKEKEERRLLKLYLFRLGVMHVCVRERGKERE